MPPSGETAPVWASSVINIDVPIGTPISRALSSSITGSPADTFEVIASERAANTTILPSGLDLDSAGNLTGTYSGSAGSLVLRVRAKRHTTTEAAQVGNWWSYLTTHPSLTSSQAFVDAASVRDISDTMSGTPARSQWDSTTKLPGFNGALRQDILDTDAYPSPGIANWGWRLKQAGGGFLPGEGFTVVSAIRVNRARVFDFANTDGVKFYIISTAPNVLGGPGGGSSFQPYERVLDDASNAGYFRGYYSSSFAYWDQSVTAVSGSNVGPDFVHQPSINRGTNPLSGVDPATNSAWSAYQQERAKRGGLWSWTSGQGTGATGTKEPDPVTGAVILALDQWVLVEEQIMPGTPGTNTTTRRVRAAPFGQDWTTLYQSTSEGMDSLVVTHGGFTGIQFTNSATNMTAQAGVRATPASQWLGALVVLSGLVNTPAVGF